MMAEKVSRKDKKENQNIQVFVRLRPLNQRERDIKSLGVVEVVNGREVVVRPSHHQLHTKKFTFDKVFPPQSKQVEVYQNVVSPLIEEVLAGYNCTVFAYGQTGTGKTHTMVGEAAADETTWQSDPLAGIIPRALSQLFDELRLSNTEYTVRVSYLELYNEELFDLLSRSDDNSKLRIYEDVTKKGANIVNGLEEITVYNKNEVYRIMSQGQERRRVASTLMNAQSSRSHTVFTIVVHMKDNSAEGEELVKLGKLNLVDLAGSENISKAGSDNPGKRERARECVNINQSLLTLGRVITALVERHPHIPYRESKLTRILQESLGGRTKTSIIATISPGHKDLEETLSTLEYANRAKNIQNKPEINQKMTKKAILKEYSEEIDKLKRDLQAARDKNGIYLANETYAEWTFKQEEQKKEIQELLLKKRAMEEERDRMESVFEELQNKLQSSEGQLLETIEQLNTTKSILSKTTNKLVRTEQQCSEQRYLVQYREQKERALADEARQLLTAADAAASDAAALSDAVHRRSTIESRNLETTQRYRGVSAQMRRNMRSVGDAWLNDVATQLATADDRLRSYENDSNGILSDSIAKMDDLIKNTSDNYQMMCQAKDNLYTSMSGMLYEQNSMLTKYLQTSHDTTRTTLVECTENVASCLQNAGQIDISSQLIALFDEWLPITRAKIQTAYNTHGATHQWATRAARTLAASARATRDATARAADMRARHVQMVLQAIKTDEEQNKKYLADSLEKIEKERVNRETILEQWIEKKKRQLEEEIHERVTTERQYLDKMMVEHKNSVEEQTKAFEESTSRNVQMLMELLTENDREMQIAEERYRESEKETENCVSEMNGLAERYEQESADVESSVSCVGDRVVSVADQMKARLVAELKEAEQSIRSQAERLVSSDEAAARAHAAGVTAALETVAETCRHAVDGLLSELDRQTTSTAQQLTSLSSSASQCSELLVSHQSQQAATLDTMKTGAQNYHTTLLQELNSHQQLEDRCLQDEYTVYTPSGCTPARPRYVYPRRLTTASPHEKVLRRYRDSRPPPVDEHDDDVILIDDDMTNGNSDTESSASESSAPSPRAPSTGATPHDASTPRVPAAIVKCTSETDIYLRKKESEQSKENHQVNRSMCFKKPSKLPAPNTKKILAERNGEH